MEFATAGHFESVASGEVDTQADVDLELFLETVPDLARGHELSFAAAERRAVDQEVERDGRLVDRDRRKWLYILIVDDGFADEDIGESGDEHDVTRLHFGRLLFLESAECVHLGDLARAGFTARLLHEHGVTHLERTVVDAGDRETTEKVVVAEVERLCAKRLCCRVTF